jgi:1A family penicillin-binding protein
MCEGLPCVEKQALDESNKMSGTGKKKSAPLVADKRYPKKKTAGKPKAGKPKLAKPKPTKRKTATAARTRTRKPKARTGRAKARRGNRVLLFFGGLFRWIFRLIWRLSLRGAAVMAIILALAVFYFYTTLPPLSQQLDARIRGSVTLLDRNDTVFAWRGEQYGGQISATAVSPYLKNAIIATEDKRFYNHFGVSPRGIASAVRINLAAGRGPLSGNGGSTITQQVAKLLCVGVPYDPAKWATEKAFEAYCRQGSLWRKAKEAVYALALEAKYTKDQILTIYLNRSYLGAGSRGFEAASQRYFGKSAARDTPAEAAMLAGLLKAPSRYAPTRDLKRSQGRADLIIGLMQDQGYLTPSQAAEAIANPAQLSPAAQARAGGYFADWVMDSGPAFLTRDTTEDVMIRTTLDQRIQKAAEDAMQSVFENQLKDNPEVQAAIVVMSADGAVRAMVGGRKTKGVAGQFNRAVQAKRQTGSAFKPFVYAAALDLGYTYADTVLDGPITIDIPGSGPWSPTNYSDKFKGLVTLTDALKFSLNTPAVRLSEAVGRDNVRTVAEDFGIQSDLAQGPALALGVSESTLLEMTGAYAGILNGGSSVTPYGLIELRLKGDQDPLMDQTGGIGERVISPDAAKQLIYMMNQVVNGGTAQRAAIPGREIAAKTGTTQKWRDAWFLGFTADYVTGVWMGNDDNSSMPRITGGSRPADIWRETMVKVLEGTPARLLPMDRPAEPPVAQAEETGPGITPPPPPAPVQDTTADRVLLNVLQSIFGKRNR